MDDDGSAMRRLRDLLAPPGESELARMYRRCAAIEELHRRNAERSTKALNDWYELKAVLHAQGLRWSAAPAASGEEGTPAGSMAQRRRRQLKIGSSTAAHSIILPPFHNVRLSRIAYIHHLDH
jgi:hypothetical protein